jgi:membrane protease subunit HflC
MKRASLIALVVVTLLVLMVIGGVFYIVDETEQVVITQFGEPMGDPITTPGLKMKMPFIQKANYFDKRFLEWDGERNQVPTRDKRFIWVDTYARWQITDPLKFFQRLRDERGAQSRLADILDGETRNAVARHVLLELVRTSDREFVIVDEAREEDEMLSVTAMIEVGRGNISREVLETANERCADLGITVLDFQFKRINYVPEVSREVYNRMISERQRIAEQFRSEGEGEAARIEGEKEKLLREITSEAYREAQEIKGKADANATRIYAAAHNKDPDFYAFLKTMQVYDVTMDDETILLMGTDGEFLRYLGRSK